jgi:hypothetical protein
MTTHCPNAHWFFIHARILRLFAFKSAVGVRLIRREVKEAMMFSEIRLARIIRRAANYPFKPQNHENKKLVLKIGS